MPAGVVGEIGADQTICELQLLLHRNTRLLYHHAPVIPTVDWERNTYQNLNDTKSILVSCSVHDSLSLTVALVQAEAAVAEAELSCPVRLRQARVYPGAVVPAAVRFGVDFQTGLDEVQLRLIQLLHLVLLSRGRTEKYISLLLRFDEGMSLLNDFIYYYSVLKLFINTD